ncbi:MAG: hypothetical protein ACI4R8_01665 [Candidatus Caccovivens sp.]
MENKSNSKLVWYILFAVVTVVLCYLFAVVYFYFISPYNIALKIGFWPFVSDTQIADMYADATVEIEFKVQNSEFQDEEKKVLGVNVRKDGYIIAPYSDFENVNSDTIIKIYSNSGTIFYGKVLFADKDYDLTVIKCQNTAEGEGEIKLPYVSIASISNIVEGDEIICVSNPVSDKHIRTGEVYDIGYDVPNVTEQDGMLVVDRIQENCFVIDLDLDGTQFTGGAVFDKNASLLGFSYGSLTDVSAGFAYVMPAEAIKFVLDNVVEKYQSNSTFSCAIRDKFVGFDQAELSWFIECSQRNTGDENNFYFNKSWHSYSDEITYYANSDYSGYYLMNEFVHKDVTISSNSAITALKIGTTTYNIKNKYDLFEIIYKLSAGERVTIFYEQFEGLTAHAKSVIITV